MNIDNNIYTVLYAVILIIIVVAASLKVLQKKNEVVKNFDHLENLKFCGRKFRPQNFLKVFTEIYFTENTQMIKA